MATLTESQIVSSTSCGRTKSSKGLYNGFCTHTNNPSISSCQAPPPPGPIRGKKEASKAYTMVYINDECLTLNEELGQGEFGSVLRGKYKPPNSRPVSPPTHDSDIA